MDNYHKIAEMVGVTLSDRNVTRRSYVWDGKSIATRWNDHPRSASNILHDIAHYQVAHPAYRNKPEFGLGPSPDMGKYPGQPHEHSSEEESLASMLGILWEMSVGGSWRKTLEDHNWEYLEDVLGSLFALQDLWLVDGYTPIPTCAPTEAAWKEAIDAVVVGVELYELPGADTYRKFWGLPDKS